MYFAFKNKSILSIHVTYNFFLKKDNIMGYIHQIFLFFSDGFKSKNDDKMN
jgi:hypothetical protein